MRRILLFLALVLSLSLVSCGTASVATAPPRPTTLQVDRATHTTNFFSPLSRTITKATTVQTLYNAALALPKVSTAGPAHSCPADFDLTYHLKFYQDNVLAQQMDMYPSGCPYITISKSEEHSLSKAFIALFAQTIGISPSQLIVAPIPQKTKPTP